MLGTFVTVQTLSTFSYFHAQKTLFKKRKLTFHDHCYHNKYKNNFVQFHIFQLKKFRMIFKLRFRNEFLYQLTSTWMYVCYSGSIKFNRKRGETSHSKHKREKCALFTYPKSYDKACSGTKKHLKRKMFRITIVIF